MSESLRKAAKSLCLADRDDPRLATIYPTALLNLNSSCQELSDISYPIYLTGYLDATPGARYAPQVSDNFRSESQAKLPPRPT